MRWKGLSMTNLKTNQSRVREILAKISMIDNQSEAAIRAGLAPWFLSNFERDAGRYDTMTIARIEAAERAVKPYKLSIWRRLLIKLGL